MTEMEKLTLNRMIQRNPMLKEMITRLQIDINHKTEAELLSQKIQNRVEGWYQEFRKVLPMEIIHESPTCRLFWTDKELAYWIKITNFEL